MEGCHRQAAGAQAGKRRPDGVRRGLGTDSSKLRIDVQVATVTLALQLLAVPVNPPAGHCAYSNCRTARWPRLFKFIIAQSLSKEGTTSTSTALAFLHVNTCAPLATQSSPTAQDALAERCQCRLTGTVCQCQPLHLGCTTIRIFQRVDSMLRHSLASFPSTIRGITGAPTRTRRMTP